MTFLEGRPGAEEVEDLIQLAIERKRHLFISTVNWGEVYYSIWRAKGPGVARKVIEDIEQLPVEVVAADLELTTLAAELRAENKLGYTDCFAAALALARKGALATSDRDFAVLDRKIEILWTTT
jgi:predicted nucleic acid-binding protein